ncbi:stage III sporulation protein AA [Peribacillus alkalitolerans]|uniref:stage III sporulation protein AA n=1 Tax=Peribacillus alkalitolerans TaxID=1550385 RepID=UPI0013D3EA46|nr:stage III sporulation protein AA [Peribacillus alkalitolerans]
MERILSILPKRLAEPIRLLPESVKNKLEEIRLRVGRPIEIGVTGKPSFLPLTVNEEDALQLINNVSQFSFYTIEEELRRGYITIQGGHRIGLAGKVILDKGQVKSIRDISSFNIRIARERIGVSQGLLPFLYDGRWQNTLILGPPQTGKTTLLRDIARILSSGIPSLDLLPVKVGIVDERSELAGCVNGVPQLSFGPRIDVLDGCPKAEGMMMLIRSMSPEIIIADEIGRPEDTEAVLEAANAGITLMVTTHGYSFSDVKKRPTLKEILQLDIFTRILELKRNDATGMEIRILDGQGNQITILTKEMSVN